MNEYVKTFFKKMGFFNKDYFDLIESNTTIIDMEYKEIKEFVGFYPNSFKLVLPKIKTLKDVLIWIHEYSHALFPDSDDEIFPNLMEAYFINNYIENKEIINKLIEETKIEIDNSKDLKHTIAKKIKLNTITKN